MALLLFSPLNAQNRDSLRNIVEGSYPDTTKIKVLRDLCWIYLNPPLSKLDSGEYYTDVLRAIAFKIEDHDLIAITEYYYGVKARHLGQFEKALGHTQEFYQHFSSVGDTNRMAFAHFQNGNILSNMGEYDQAIEELYQALRLHKHSGDLSSVNYALNSIGTILKTAGRFEEAIATYEQVLATDSVNADVLMNLGNVYSEQKRYTEALQQYKRALVFDRASKNNWAIAYDLENIGTVYYKLEQFDSAEIYFEESYQLRSVNSAPEQKAISAIKMAAVKIELKETAKAAKYLAEADSLSIDLGSLPIKRDVSLRKSAYYKALGDYQMALNWYEVYAQQKDSLLNETTTKQINELQTRFETAKKDQQIELLGKEKEIQVKETQRQATLKNAFIAGAILVALSALIGFLSIKSRMRNQKLMALKNQELKEAKFQRQLSDLEMKALQAQINPHFIFNCLNSINQMILEGQDVQASRYLTKFSKLIRLILEHSENSEITLQDELSVLESYIELEQLRYQGEIDYQLNVHQDLDPMDTYLPAMVLQPFVENAIWHGLGLRPERQGGKITIAAKQEGNWLKCEIEDNGVGRAHAQKLKDQSLIKHKSMGLKITEERLSLLSTEKESDQQLINIIDLKDDQGVAQGTRVELAIPT